MKEAKVYVDELPIQCIDCQFAYSGKCQLNGEIYCIENCRRSDCPLQSLETHDRELVKEVCEKIKQDCWCGGAILEDDYYKVPVKYLQNLQKEFEK